MAAILLVAGAATLAALLGLLGRVADDRRFTWPQATTLVLPAAAVCAALYLQIGFTWVSAVIAALTLFLGVVVAALLGGVRDVPYEGQAVRAGFAWVASGLVVVGLAGLFLSWIANLIASFSTLNAGWVAVVLVLASAAVAYGRGSSRGTAVTVAVVTIAGGLLLLAGGVAAGSFSSLSDAVIEVGDVRSWQYAAYGASVVVATGSHLGLRSVAARQRGTLLVAGAITAVATLLALIGLLMLVGGAIELPSVPLETLVAYTPASVSALVAGVLALTGVIAAGQSVAVVLRAANPLGPMLNPLHRPRLARLTGVVVMGVGLVIIAVWQPSPNWLVPVIAVLGLLGLVIEFSGGREATGALESRADEPANA